MEDAGEVCSIIHSDRPTQPQKISERRERGGGEGREREREREKEESVTEREQGRNGVINIEKERTGEET